MDRETEAHLAGSRGESFPASTFLEALAHERGERSRSGGAAGFPLPALPLLAVLLACFWPLVGVGTMFGAAVAAALAEWTFHHGIVTLLAMFAGGVVAYNYSFKLEQILQRSRIYRLVRHPVRLVLLGMFFVWWALMWGHGTLNPLAVPKGITLRWIDSQLSATAYVVIVMLLVLAHWLSKRFDEKVDVWVRARRMLGAAPDSKDDKVAELAVELLQEKDEERRARWKRRLKVGSVFGMVAAIFLAVIGEPAGSIVFGFCFFGLIGALLSRFISRKPRVEPKGPPLPD